MDFEKIASCANTIDSAIRDNTALKSIIVDASTAMMDDDSYETRQSIQEFLDLPLGDKKDIAIKKAFAAAMVVAKERNIISDLPDSGAEIGAIVDEGWARAKTAYQVGIGLLDSEAAIDHIVDLGESRLLAAIDLAFDSGLVNQVATEAIVKAAYAIPGIGPIIGPTAEACKPIIQSTLKVVEKPIKQVIKTGIHTVATTAKSIAHNAIDTVKSYASSVFSKISSWF